MTSNLQHQPHAGPPTTTLASSTATATFHSNFQCISHFYNRFKSETTFTRKRKFEEAVDEQEDYCGETRLKRRRLSFTSLCSDVVLHIFSYHTFYSIDSQTWKIGDLYGRFYDSTIHPLFVNIQVSAKNLEPAHLQDTLICLRRAKVVYCSSGDSSYLLRNLKTICPYLKHLLCNFCTRIGYEELVPYCDMIRQIGLNEDGLFLIPLLKNIDKITIADVFLNIDDLKKLIAECRCKSLTLDDVSFDECFFPIAALEENQYIERFEVYNYDGDLCRVSLKDLAKIPSSIRALNCRLPREAFLELTNNPLIEELLVNDLSAESIEALKRMKSLKSVVVYLVPANVKQLTSLIASNSLERIEVRDPDSDFQFSSVDISALFAAIKDSTTEVVFHT